MFATIIIFFSRRSVKKKVEKDSLGLLVVGENNELNIEVGLDTVRSESSNVVGEDISEEAYVDESNVVGVDSSKKNFEDLFVKVEDVKWKYVFVVNGEVVLQQLIEEEDIEFDIEKGSGFIDIKSCIGVKVGDFVEIYRTEYVRVLDYISVRTADEICFKIVPTENEGVFAKCLESSVKVDGENLAQMFVEFDDKNDVVVEEMSEMVVEKSV